MKTSDSFNQRSKRYQDYDLIFPSERKSGTGIASRALIPTVDLSNARFEELQTDDLYPSMLEFFSTYVRETVPDPLHSEGLWILTAYPRTKSRLPKTRARLTVGPVETAIVRNDGVTALVLAAENDVETYLTSLPDSMRFSIAQAGHRTFRNMDMPALWVESADVGTAIQLLAHDRVLDAAYAVNVELMLKGTGNNANNNNEAFAAAVLTRAVPGTPA